MESKKQNGKNFKEIEKGIIMPLLGYCNECGREMIITIYTRIPPLCEECEKKEKKRKEENAKNYNSEDD